MPVPRKVNIRRKAMDLLARREHSRYELMHKLRRYSSVTAIDSVLEVLESEKLLSDERFAEMIVRSCANKGYGPIYIRQKLAMQQVEERLIISAIDESGVDWQQLAVQQRAKHFGRDIPENKKIQLKQMQYLQRRGFSLEQVRLAIR